MPWLFKFLLFSEKLRGLFSQFASFALSGADFNWRFAVNDTGQLQYEVAAAQTGFAGAGLFLWFTHRDSRLLVSLIVINLGAIIPRTERKLKHTRPQY
jgi:hypothetical protein